MSVTQHKPEDIVGYWQPETPPQSGFYLFEFGDGTVSFLHCNVGTQVVRRNGKDLPFKIVKRWADVGGAKDQA